MTCKVCKKPYNQKLKTKHQLVYFSAPLLLLLKDKKTSIALLLGFFLLGFAWLPLLQSILLVVLVLGGFCLYTGLRPGFLLIDGSVRISLIRFGAPVNNLRTGVLLKATPRISSGIFNGSKVLITKYSVNGAEGFVINKRLNVQGSTSEIRIGGPVEMSRTFTVHEDVGLEGSTPVSEHLALGGRQPREGLRKVDFQGISSWGALQLDGEVRSGVWEVEEVNSEELLSLLFR